MRLLLPLFLIVLLAGPAMGQSLPGSYPPPNSVYLGGEGTPVCSCNGATGTFSIGLYSAKGWYVTPYNGCTLGAACPYTQNFYQWYSSSISAPAGYCLGTVDAYVNSSTYTPVPTCQTNIYGDTECPGVDIVYYDTTVYWVYPTPYQC